MRIVVLCGAALMLLIEFLSIQHVLGRENACVATSKDEYVCTNDPVRTAANGRSLGKSSLIDRGVTQRIDGSETEKRAVREVLKLMDEYFVYEVMAKPEYEPVRSRCQNSNKLCAFWASVGECESNRIFMLGHCAAACRMCLLANTNIA
mmetsp:Transcript_9860/g.16470  ORF Transcript_9860/g.16470 Transcript_9860/m.16470 type:complete len:149 (+) Transcript_9860:148-594(+)